MDWTVFRTQGPHRHSGRWESGDEMFRCERCGSSFSPIRVSRPGSCPRCRARDGVSIPLTFAPFSAKPPEADDAARDAVQPPGDKGDERSGTAKT